MAELDYSKICRQAVETARERGADFDYSPESISELERILIGQNELYKQGRISDIYVWNLSVMMGVYLGQTLLFCALSERGFAWRTDADGVPYLTDGKDSYVSPIYQVRSRITGGPDDNVRAFFEAILDVSFRASMKPPMQ